MFKTSLWQAQIEEASVVDYSTFELAEAGGFAPEALVEDDYERCQTEACRLMAHGVRGLLCPSAALPGSVNITIFGPRVHVPWDTPRRLAAQMPVQRISTGGPPPGITMRVRYFGEEHSDLGAFLERRRAEGRS